METNIALLKGWAVAEGVEVPDDVATYLAGKFGGNVRDLEGSLIRVIAYASLTGQDISLQLAQSLRWD